MALQHTSISLLISPLFVLHNKLKHPPQSNDDCAVAFKYLEYDLSHLPRFFRAKRLGCHAFSRTFSINNNRLKWLCHTITEIVLKYSDSVHSICVFVCALGNGLALVLLRPSHLCAKLQLTILLVYLVYQIAIRINYWHWNDCDGWDSCHRLQRPDFEWRSSIHH